MCGLVYFKSFNKEDVLPDLRKRYEAQKTRGQQGFGVFYPGTSMIYRAETEDKILLALDSATDKEVVEALFHHRMPTSTPNVLNAAHPFSTGNMFRHNYVLAHNGVIWNDTELKEEHEERGIKYASIQGDGKFNDSESLLWEMAMYLEGMTDTPGTKGGAAFIVIEQVYTKNRTRPVKLHFGRNEADPLFLTLTDERIVLASEKDRWDDDAHSIMPDFLYTFDYRTKKLSFKPMKLETYRRPPISTTYHGGRFIQGRGWVKDEEHRSLLHAGDYSRSLEDDKQNEDYYNSLFDSIPSASDPEAKLVGLTGKKMENLPQYKLLTGDELDIAADNMLAHILDREEDIEAVEGRLQADLKRAQQAVAQLGEIVRGGGARPKVVKKYYKYLQFLNTCTRAMAMMTLIADPQGSVVEVTNE